ncbi:MAG: hypothetical protein DRQ78_00800 [Epsilonproteobacteria bacterium]|nr:MAG: hypothetical protein DRQ78_00800 [Campylobacterota bacterium]
MNIDTKINKDIYDLKQIDRANRQARRIYQTGFIRKISPQGDRLFVVVQRGPETEVDRHGEITTKPGRYFGNEVGFTTNNITLSELLIETDVDLSAISAEESHWIGKEVTVEMVNSYPIKAVLTAPGTQPRRIDRQTLLSVKDRAARKKGVDIDSDENLLDDEAKKYLRIAGYTDEEIDATFQETLDSLSGSNVLNYGTAGWQYNQLKTGETTDMSKSAEAGIVTSLPAASASTDGFCFKPNKALTAR